MTLTFKLVLGSVKMNCHSNYLGHRSFSSNVFVWTYRRTHTGPTAVPGPMKWSVKID